MLHRHRARVLILVAGTIVVKLVVLLQLRHHPLLSPDAGLDTTAYVDLARRVLTGDAALGPGVYYVSPLYIYVLAAGLAVFDSFTAVRVVQVALGTVSVWCIFLTARLWFGERAAWAAAVLAALTGLFTFYEVLILQASIDAFLTSAALYCFSRRKYLLSGLVFGIQALNRPNVLIAAGLVALVMPLVGVRIRAVRAELRRGAALLAIGMAAGIAPVAIRNVVIAREFTPISSHGGLNFYIGNSDRATGFYTNVPGITPSIVGQEVDARRVASLALGRPASDGDTSKYFFHLASSWIAAHPGRAAVLFVKKLYYTFNAAHVALPHSYPFYVADGASMLRLLPVGPWLLIPLGLAGLIVAPGLTRDPATRARYLVFASFVPAYAISVALFFVAERYRLPLLVPLCVGAGALVAAVVSRPGLKTGAGRPGLQAPVYRPGLWTATVLALGVAANWPLHLSDGRWEEALRLAQRYVILGDYDAADRWGERLDSLDASRRGAAQYGLGAQLLLADQPRRAVPHLESAHAAQPSDVRLEYALGQALLKAGRPVDAVPHLRRGFESGEDMPGGGFDLAEALAASGDVRGAAAFAPQVRLDADVSVDAWLRLGRIAHEARQPALAEVFFRRAAELQPDLARARQQYGLNLMALARFDDAARELRQALRLEPRNADSLSALAYCEVRRARPDEARALAAAALAINPADPLAAAILRGGGS